MSQAQVTLDAESVNLLDSTAAATAFSREEALKEAIENYSVYDRWFRAKVEEGEQSYQEGRYISNDEAKERSKARLEQMIAAKGSLA